MNIHYQNLCDFYADKTDEIVKHYMERAFLYSDHEIIVLAYPHRRENVLRQDLNYVVDNPDCWVITYFSGEIKRLLEVAPFELPYVAFERKRTGTFRVYSVEKLVRRIRYGKQ